MLEPGAGSLVFRPGPVFANVVLADEVNRCTPKTQSALLEAMAEHDIKLLIHGEVTDNHIDIVDREALFLERTLAPLIKSISGLKVVLEHITTANAVDFVNAADSHLAATITAHHLL